MWIQSTLIAFASLEYYSKIIMMINSLSKMNNQIIKISFNNSYCVVKSIQHGPLEYNGNIFKTKMHFPVCECTSWENKLHFMIVIKRELDFIITIKSNHNRKCFTPSTWMNNLNEKRCGTLSLRKKLFKLRISIHIDNCFHFVSGNKIINPFSQKNQIDKMVHMPNPFVKHV